MTRHTLALALAVALATGFAATPVDAAGPARSKPGAKQKIYKCKDAQGQIYYSQSYDPKLCGAQGGAQLNEQGLPVKQIERVKTPEELAAEKAKAEQEAAAKQAIEDRKRDDQVLLMSYASEDDLKRSHEQQMQAIDTAIATTNMQLGNQQKSLADLLASAAEAERAGRPVPPALATSIATVRTQIEEQNTYIARKEAEKADAEKSFAEKLAHYREVVKRQEDAAAAAGIKR